MMANPKKFTPGYSYSGWQASSPSKPLPAPQVDNDMANIATSIGETIEALKDVRRSDGALRNGIVTADSLAPSLTLGLETPQPWAAGTVYTVLNTVFVDETPIQGIYRAKTSHTSTTFAADLAEGDWELIFSLSDAGLSAVAQSGSYADLLDKPALGTAAAGDIGVDVQAHDAVLDSVSGLALVAGDLLVATGSDTFARLPKGTDDQVLKIVAGSPVWGTVTGAGDMLAATYDPQAIGGDAFDHANHTGPNVTDDGSVGDAKLAVGSQVEKATFSQADTAVSAEALILPAAVDRITTSGLREAGDGGGGTYVAAASEPATQPKFFNANVNRWFTGTETVMDIMRFGARRLGAGTAGTISANDAAFADAKEWLHGRLIAGAYPELQFGPGVYDYGIFPNFAKDRARLIGLGDVRLRYHGDSTAVVLDGEAINGGEDGTWEMAFVNFKVEPTLGNAQIGDGILLRAIHESDIAVEVRGGRADGVRAGMRLEWCVSPRIKYRCSVNGFGWYAGTAPSYGIYIDDHPTYTGYTATSLAQINADITGPNIGIGLNMSNSNMIKGTVQSCPQAGLFADAGCLDTVFYNMDLEAHPVHAAVILGKGNILQNVVSLEKILFDGTASGNRVLGGAIQEIELTATTFGNWIETNVNRVAGGGITDTGTGNSIGRCWDVVNQTNVTRPKTTLSITPSGTLRTWTNPRGDPMMIGFTGGVTEGFQINGENVAPPSPNGAQYVVPPGNIVAWDSSSAPTVKVWGL